MPYLPTAQSWLQNSTLLLSARPTTTRITTKYTIPHGRSADSGKASRPRSPSKTKSVTSTPAPPAAAATAVATGTSSTTTTSHHHQQQPATKAVLVLKTYDPVSGTCLKYRTDKAADVGRLIAALGTCGRVMAALPDERQKGPVEKDEDGGDGIIGAAEPKGKMDGSEMLLGRGGEKEKEGKGKTSAGGGGGGGGGKKKKGKR